MTAIAKLILISILFVALARLRMGSVISDIREAKTVIQ